MATKNNSKKRDRRGANNDDRPLITSRTVAVVVVLLAAMGLLSARFGLGPDSEPVAAIGADGDQAEGNQVEGETEATAPQLAAAPPDFGPAAELTDLDGWINTEADVSGLASYDGQVRIVKFWTFGCFNCKNTLPHLKEIYNRYHPEGLEIIAVHAPEFDYEADPVNINAAVVEQGIVWPVALDTSKTNFRSWQGDRRFWPRIYVLDQNGNIRFDHIGEGAYDELEATVAYLLANGA